MVLARKCGQHPMWWWVLVTEGEENNAVQVEEYKQIIRAELGETATKDGARKEPTGEPQLRENGSCCRKFGIRLNLNIEMKNVPEGFDMLKPTGLTSRSGVADIRTLVP